MCYPHSKSVLITEHEMTVEPQALLDKTTERLLLHVRDHISDLPDSCINLRFYLKWGFDGASGLNPYKQRCNDHTLDDTHALMTLVYHRN